MNALMKMPRMALLAAAMTATLMLTACGKSEPAEGKAEQEKKEENHGPEGLKLTSEEAARAGVKLEAASQQPTASTVVVTASIQPDQDRIARVAPRTEARVTSAPAKLGDRVRAGQVLATLDSVSVGEAYATLAQARSELRIAEADFQRAESLVADEIIPRKDYLRSRSERDKAQASVRAATDRLRLLGGSDDAARRTVSGFAVQAPFAGTVIAKKATLGDLASPNDPMFTVADLSRVWILADLPEAALAQVQVGANAQVTVPSLPGETFRGRVSYIGAALSKETRTASARIEVANADGRLKPEMFATATIEVAGAQRNLMTLPDTAIVLMGGQPTVFVHEQGAYQMRAIQPGQRLGGRTVVVAGLKPGEQVVTAGAYELKARKQKSQLGEGH